MREAPKPKYRIGDVVIYNRGSDGKREDVVQGVIDGARLESQVGWIYYMGLFSRHESSIKYKL